MNADFKMFVKMFLNEIKHKFYSIFGLTVDRDN